MAIDAARFVDCIDNDVEPELNAAAAAGIAETILGGYESAARGEEVPLPLPQRLAAGLNGVGRFPNSVVPSETWITVVPAQAGTHPNVHVEE